MWNTFILSPMVNVLIWIYNFFFHNFGLAIIIFTILIRLITYPLTAQQVKGQQKMQELQSSKKWQEIQKKHKGDKQKIQQEQAKFMQEKGINPLGSCLPTLIQFPIIIIPIFYLKKMDAIFCTCVYRYPSMTYICFYFQFSCS